MLIRFFIVLLIGLFASSASAALIPGFYPGWQAYKKQPEKVQVPLRASGGGFSDPTTGMEFVRVKGGCFQMGSDGGDSDEKPVHEVCVDDFYMGKYEVTQAQWQAIMGSNPSGFKGDKRPVENVSWNDVQDYIRKLNSNSGKSYRLPSEAEWEYAARSGGKKEKWSGTSSESSLGEYAWYGKNSNNQTHAVGSKQANGLGLYDMNGNVWEWVNDWYNGSYSVNSPRQNPQGPSTGTHRVNRGGSWGGTPGGLRSAIRFRRRPGFRYDHLGFRLVLP